MSQNIQQIFVANPASSMVSTDLLYLGRSPYDTTDDFAITFANFVASIGTATPTASTIPRWDAHVNMSANNFLEGYATTATAAATTTLTVSSAYNQYFTGTTTQTAVMPVVTTLALGHPFRIVNNSTGVVTVQSSGANTIQTMAAGSTLYLTCIAITGTTAASWDAQYIVSADVSGAVLLAPAGNQTITGNHALGAYNFTASNSMNTPIINDANGNAAILLPAAATAVNQLTITNSAAASPIILSATGTDSNITLEIFSKGTGAISLVTAAPTQPITIYSGTSNQKITTFNMANTAGTNNITWPDASGTVALEVDGTFTPVLKFGGGVTGITYATQTGYYTTCGKTLTFSITIVLTSKGSSTGGVTITGLPVTSRTGPTASSMSIAWSVLTYAAQPTALIESASTVIELYSAVTTGGIAALLDTNFANNTTLYITGTYLI